MRYEKPDLIIRSITRKYKTAKGYYISLLLIWMNAKKEGKQRHNLLIYMHLFINVFICCICSLEHVLYFYSMIEKM